MQSAVVVAVIRFSFQFFLLSIFFIQKTFALALDKFKFVLNFMEQNGENGNQVYDNSGNHDVQVLEPMLFVVAKVDSETNIQANFTVDTWTAASDTIIDGETGASGSGINQQARGAGNLTYAKEYKSSAWSAGFGVSSEYDYQSLNFSGHYQKNFANDNFTLSITPQLFLDRAKDFNLQTELIGEWQGRTIGSIDVSASQFLSARDVVWFGYNIVHMNGMLNNVSNTVFVDTNPYGNAFSRIEEKMPTSRQRQAVYSQFIHAWSETSATHLRYRYYFDDWGLHANTIEVGQRLTFGDTDDWFVMPVYRYYDQSSVDFYQDQFANVVDHMTSDHDLQKFQSQRFGLLVTKELDWEKLFGHELYAVELSVGAYYYERSNNLDYSILQTSLSFAF